MARAEVASASVSSDSIKGLAQSIAKPAYRRLLTAEPALRRAVPALIIAFLLTICVGAIVQVLDHRRQTISELVKQIDAAGDLLADRIGRFEREKPGRPDRLQSELESMLPAWGRIPGRLVIIANPDGQIVAGLRFVPVSNGDGPMTGRSVTSPPESTVVIEGRPGAPPASPNGGWSRLSDRTWTSVGRPRYVKSRTSEGDPRQCPGDAESSTIA
jgi:hypothetical protein